MAGGNSRSRTYYSRRCKSSVTECIPDEVLFDILVRVPAQDIYYGARLVCRRWYHITRTKYFIHKHHERATYGLLYRNKSKAVVFISPREDGGAVDAYRLNYKYKVRNSVWSGWNGLMLEFEICKGQLIYYVTNVSTNQSFRLPTCPFDAYIPDFSGVGYDAASMKYKVVVSYLESSGGFGCGILTLGVDKSWRILRTRHLSHPGRITIMGHPIITEGFVHWKIGIEVVTLNLETEVIADTPPPVILRDRYNPKCCFLSGGSYLSLFVRREKFMWEVLEMKPETGEWRNLANVCLEGQEERIQRLGFKNEGDIAPCGWLKYKEVLVLRIKFSCVVFYNLITCEIVHTKRVSILNSLFVFQKNSLVGLGGS